MDTASPPCAPQSLFQETCFGILTAPTKQSRAATLGSGVKNLARRSFSILRPKQHNRDTKSGDPRLRTNALQGPHFLNLPPELHLQILTHLPLLTLVSLLHTSRHTRSLVLTHEPYLARTYIHTQLPPPLSTLFPQPPTLHHALTLTHKLALASTLAASLSRQVLKEMFNLHAHDATLQGQMTPLLLPLLHFFTTYIPASGKAAQAHIIASSYTDSQLLKVHQMFHLLLQLFMRRLSRPLWRSHCSREDVAKVFVCGGLEAVAEIYCATGYARRRRRMRRFLQSVEGIRVDGLEEVWVSAAEERLISRGVVEDLDEVGCCGRFVSGLLMAGQDSDSEEDEEEDSDEDEE